MRFFHDAYQFITGIPGFTGMGFAAAVHFWPTYLLILICLLAGLYLGRRQALKLSALALFATFVIYVIWVLAITGYEDPRSEWTVGMQLFMSAVLFVLSGLPIALCRH